ncbi:hypothetical protein BH11VER1_BH11VER1_21040 [soil metagenome]
MSVRCIVLMAGLTLITWPLSAAQIGIKYNREISEYPKAVLKDMERFRRDRINTVMLCFPWNQTEPAESQLAPELISEKLAPVLEYCAANHITVVISNHCSYWGEGGDWSIPGWIKSKPAYKASESCLNQPEIRALHTSFLKRLITATKDYPAVIGYNILNEPVAATKWYLDEMESAFNARWEGVLDICQQVRKHMTEIGAKQYLIIGNHGTDAGLEAYAWKNTGKYDLTPLWTTLLDKIASQGTTALLESTKWYPDRPKIRTEGYLSFAMVGATRDTEDFGKLKPKGGKGTYEKTADHEATYYDYDGAYDYEGLSNAKVPNLEASYAWRVGTSNGSAKSLTFLDHRHDDRPTPYYWALRDLAAGVDSFECFDRAVLPKKGVENATFDALAAKPGISKRWEGTGSITGNREDLPPEADSTMAARVVLQAGQSVMKKVITAHWPMSGVNATESFTFWAKAMTPTTLTLVVKTSNGTRMAPVALQPGIWTNCRVPLQTLQLKDADIPKIDSVGFVNQTRVMQAIVLDEFLIRP